MLDSTARITQAALWVLAVVDLTAQMAMHIDTVGLETLRQNWLTAFWARVAAHEHVKRCILTLGPGMHADM